MKFQLSFITRKCKCPTWNPRASKLSKWREGCHPFNGLDHAARLRTW